MAEDKMKGNQFAGAKNVVWNDTPYTSKAALARKLGESYRVVLSWLAKGWVCDDDKEDGRHRTKQPIQSLGPNMSVENKLLIYADLNSSNPKKKGIEWANEFSVSQAHISNIKKGKFIATKAFRVGAYNQAGFLIAEKYCGTHEKVQAICEKYEARGFHVLVRNNTRLPVTIEIADNE